MAKLSKAQIAMLNRMAAHPHGFSFCPWGFRGAGPEASRWYRTVRILQRLGFANRDRGCAWITDAGRAALKEAE